MSELSVCVCVCECEYLREEEKRDQGGREAYATAEYVFSRAIERKTYKTATVVSC